MITASPQLLVCPSCETPALHICGVTVSASAGDNRLVNRLFGPDIHTRVIADTPMGVWVTFSCDCCGGLYNLEMQEHKNLAHINWGTPPDLSDVPSV